MCNLKSEGGRCYTHVKQTIIALRKSDEETALKLARESGVPVDAAVVKQTMDEYDRLAAQRQAMRDQNMEYTKAQMMEAHAEALEAKKEFENNPLTGKEMLARIKNSEQVTKLKQKIPGVDSTPLPSAYDLPEFEGYPDAQRYVEAFQYARATKEAQDEAGAALADAKARHEAALERKVIKQSISLRALRRRSNIARFRAMDIGHIPEEAEYNNALYKAMDEAEANGEGFANTPEHAAHYERIGKLREQAQEADRAYRLRQDLMRQHLDKSAGNRSWYSNPVNDLHEKLKDTKEGHNYSYEALKVKHYSRKFASLKESYIASSNSLPDKPGDREKALAMAQKNAPLDEYEFAAYRTGLYPRTPEARAIRMKLEDANRELVMTQTYRKNMKNKIEDIEAQGQDSTKLRQQLETIERAKKARSTPRSVPGPKYDIDSL